MNKPEGFILIRSTIGGVSKAVWVYQIGGYQVLVKYLTDRKKRVFSLEEIEHYRRVVKAIEMTREVQGEVDEKKLEKIFGPG